MRRIPKLRGALARRRAACLGHALALMGLVALGAPPGSAQETPAPTPAATPAPTPAPTPGVDELVDQLMKASPEALKAKFDTLKDDSAKMRAQAQSLRKQADDLETKAADLLRRIEIMENLLGIAPAPTARAPAPEEKKVSQSAPPPMPKVRMAAARTKTHAITYNADIRRIFAAKCGKCHNRSQAKGGLTLLQYGSLMAGGGSGEVIAAGDPDSSRLYRLITHTEEPGMPLNGAKLEDATLELIRRWIEAGAPEAADSKVELETTNIAMAPPAAEELAEEGAAPVPAGDQNPALSPLAGPHAIRSIAASPTAPIVALTGLRQLLFYDVESHELLAAAPFAEGTIESLRFSPNGALLIAAGGEAGAMGVAALYDVVTGRRLAEYGHTFDSLFAADITLDHLQVALGGAENTVQVYSTTDEDLMYEIATHTDWIQALAFSPDGWFLASGDRAGGLYVWIAENGRDVHTLRGHDGAVHALDYRADSNVLASAGADGTVRLWEMEDGKQIKKWNAHAGGALSVRFARDGRLVSSGVDGRVKLWAADGKHLRDFPALGDWAYTASFAARDSRVVAGSWLGEVKVWEPGEGKEVGMLRLTPEPITEAVVAQAP